MQYKKELLDVIMQYPRDVLELVLSNPKSAVSCLLVGGPVYWYVALD